MDPTTPPTRVVVPELAARQCWRGQGARHPATLVYRRVADEETILEDSELYKITKGRDVLSKAMQDAAISAMMVTFGEETRNQFGIRLIDIVVRQIKYSDELTESVYRRMIAERNQIAQAFRSDGEGKKAAILGEMQRELLSIQSGAYRTAQTIKGEADAQAAAIYANTYNRNPDFYEFWKAVESYRTMLPKFRKTLTTEPEYFKYLYDRQGR